MGWSYRHRSVLANPGRSALFAAAALLAGSSGCGDARAPKARSDLRLPVELIPYVLDPSAFCPAGGALTADAAILHRQLLADGDAARAEAGARTLLARDPQSVAARLALAQALFAAGRHRDVAVATDASPEELRACPALAVVRGRSFELAEDVARAYPAYREAAPSVKMAAARAAAIAGPAREASRLQFSTALAAGRIEAASYFLGELERYWPRSEEALRSRLDHAAATGDSARELAAARALQEALGEDPDLALRRARLEVEVGDARVGLQLLERLAAGDPSDRDLQDELARARFAWRLQNAPDPVRRLRDQPEITRADFAVLLYWMVPPVRTARPAGGRIASDILDDPAREEIVRVVNLGLMGVDETVHRFSPSSPIRQAEAIRSLLRLVRLLGGGAACSPETGAARDAACEAAAACGLIGSGTDCLPGATLSGREAIELLRAALAAAGEA